MRFQQTAIALFVCFAFGLPALAQSTGPLVMAHRGGAHELEENTLKAFRTCYEAGIRGFETDVRMTKDGVFVILHDDSLDRTHNAKGAVEHKSAEELKEIATKEGEPLLLLEELLGYFADKPGVYLELEMKTRNKELYPDERITEYCQQLLELAEAKKPEGSTYVYTSFDERPLTEIRRLDPHAQTLITASKPLSPEYIAQAKRLEVNYIGCQLSGTSRSIVKEAQKQGFKVTCWPGHTIEDYYLSLGLGADIHCTDIPLAVGKVRDQLPK
jgi:glycerophosphoryl diester phosphodiesterase